MKRILCLIVILCVLIPFVPVNAESYQGDLTPAIQVIRNKTKLHKHAPLATGVRFSKEDFQTLLGKASTHLTVLTLPVCGKLVLNGLEVEAGQSIALNDADELSFVPGQEEELETSFQFKCADRTNANALECVIRLNDSSDISAPEELTVSTYRDVMVSIPLKDGERVMKEGRVIIASSPARGILSLQEDGSVSYRPKTGYEGRDSFCYRILDACGALSAQTQVNIKVESPYMDVFFADLKDSPYHCAAIDFMKYTDFEAVKNEQGYYLFEAEAPISLDQVETMISGVLEREQYYQEVFEEEGSSPVESILEEVPANANGETTRLEAALAISRALAQTKESEQGLLERIMHLFG